MLPLLLLIKRIPQIITRPVLACDWLRHIDQLQQSVQSVRFVDDFVFGGCQPVNVSGLTLVFLNADVEHLSLKEEPKTSRPGRVRSASWPFGVMQTSDPLPCKLDLMEGMFPAGPVDPPVPVNIPVLVPHAVGELDSGYFDLVAPFRFRLYWILPTWRWERGSQGGSRCAGSKCREKAASVHASQHNLVPRGTQGVW